MSASTNLNKTHKTRFKNCKGRIIGQKSDIVNNETFMHWCPVKMTWVTRKDLLFKSYKELSEEDKQTVQHSLPTSMTIDDFIKDLQQLKPSLRKLPVKIQVENGLLFEPKAKVLLEKYQTLQDEPTQMIITHK